MTGSDKPGPKDYEVGYGKPPRASQFQPGRSGNPRGRPKRRASVGELVERELARRVSVTENGEQKSLTKLDLLIRRLTNDAIKGNNGCAKLLIAFLVTGRDGEAVLTDAPDLAKLCAEDQALLARHLRADPEG